MPESSENQPAAPTRGEARRPKRRWVRRVFVLVCLLVILLGVLVAFAPTFISTDAGRRFVLDKVNEGIVGSIDADSLTVRWGSGQSLSGVVISDSSGRRIARVGRIELPNASLWSVVQGGLALGEVEIESVAGDIIGYDDGTTNLARALMPNAPQSRPSGAAAPTSPTAPTMPTLPTSPSGKPGGNQTAVAWPSGLSLRGTLRDVDIVYRAESSAEPIRLVISEAELSALDPKHMVLKLDGELSQGGNRGHVGLAAVNIRIDDLFDSAGVSQPDSATAQVDAKLSNLPVEALDQLLGQGGRLVTTLGPILNAEVQAEVTTAGGFAQINADSEHLYVDSRLLFSEGGLVSEGPGEARLTLTPAAWQALNASQADGPTSTLLRPVDINAEVRRLNLPWSEQGLTLNDAGFDLGFQIGDVNLQVKDIGEVALTSTTGSVTAMKLGQSVTAEFGSTTSVNRKRGNVVLNVRADNLITNAQRFNKQGWAVSVNSVLAHAPIAAVLDELLPHTNNGYSWMFGPTVEASVKAQLAPAADNKGHAGDFTMSLQSGGEAELQTELSGQFGFTDNTIDVTLNDRSSVAFTATPELLLLVADTLIESEPLAEESDPARQDRVTDAGLVWLGEPAAIRIDLRHVSAHLVKGSDGVFALDPASVVLEGKVTSPSIALDQDGERAATLKGLLVDISTAGLADETTLVVEAGIDYPTPEGDEPKPGVIESATTVNGLFNEAGQIAFESATYQTETHIRRAPIDLIDSLAQQNGELVGALGPRAKVDAVGSYTPGSYTPGSPSENGDSAGGIDLLLKSRSASIDAKLLIADGRWTLKADAPLSFQVTPRLSQTVLKKINPFLGDAVSAKLPIKVNVRQDGFSAPLQGVSLADVNADVLLELGELDLKGEGVLLKLLQQLGAGDSSLLSASFSPVTISLAEGKLSYKDLVMTIDKVALSFSGRVDLNSQRLDLSLSIPGDSFAGVSWLKGVIGEDQVIVVPLTGTFDKPELDFKLLTKEIGKAALEGQLRGATGGAIGDNIDGDVEAVIGGLLEELLTGKKPDTPPDEAQPQEGVADKPTLTPQEREARRERRRKRRERLEREAQQQQP